MRFLDICVNPHNPPNGDTPYLLVIQGDQIPIRSSRVVAPLMKVGTISPVIKGGLMPEFAVEGCQVVMVTPQLAGVPISVIGAVIGNLADRHQDIRRAIDILTGDL